VQDKGIVTTED